MNAAPPNDVLAQALELDAAGFHTVYQQGKRAYWTAWNRIRRTADELRKEYKPGLNVAVVTGQASVRGDRCLVVVDIDVRDKEKREEGWNAAKRFGCLKVTTLTGNGGAHCWFWLPRAELPECDKIILAESPELVSTKRAWQIEALLNRHAVTCPPSIHPDTGKEYRWKNGGITHIPDAPQALIDAIREAVRNTPGKARPPAIPDGAWDAPILFDELATPEIKPELIPGPVGKFIGALAHHTETPPALGVLIGLAVLAIATRGRVRVALDDGHSEPANIYGMAVLPSGNRKSAVFTDLSEPLVRWEREQGEALQHEITRAKSERKSREAILESRRRKLHGIKDAAGRDQEISAIAEGERTLPTVPVPPKLFSNNTTPESLANALDEQGGVFAILSDEGGVFEVLAGLYTNGQANIDVVLQGWDRGPVRVRRKDRVVDLNPALTFALAVQPAVLSSIASKRAFAGRGVLERFLYALPVSSLGARTHDKPPPPEGVRTDYRNVITNILNRADTRVLGLEPEAEREWRAFQRAIEPMMGQRGKLAHLSGWASKLPGQLLRVAGLLHLAGGRADSGQIDAATMGCALELGALLIEHAVAAFAEMGADQATAHARRCWGWIAGRASFTRGELTLAMRHTLNADRIDAVIKVLVDRNLIDDGERIAGTRGIRYRVNPRTIGN